MPTPPALTAPSHGQRRALAVLWLALAAYVCGLVGHGAHFQLGVDGWLGNLTTVGPAVLTLAVAARAGARRAEVLAVGLGSLAWAAGGVYVVSVAARGGAVTVPSPADLGFLCFYPLTTAGIALLVRRELRGGGRGVWLDSLVGALGAATALALLLGPIMAMAAGSRLTVAVSVAYPLGDLLLVAAVVGAASLQGLRDRGHWLWLAAGLVVFASADVVYALRIAHGTYRLGTPLDALWSLGLLLLAVWACHAPAATPAEAPEPRATSSAALTVPAVATTTALVVLLVAARVHLAVVVLVLAGATLVGAAVRTQLAFRQVVRLADARRQARTDDLTGLGNRRELNDHLTERLGRLPPAPTAVLLVDLDHFKEINDTLGHDAGDELLRLVGPRLALGMRAGDLLVRTGGDEFALVLDTGREAAEAAGERAVERLREPFVVDGVRLRVGASIGIALAPLHAVDPGGLLQRADVAMYAAKRRGGGVSVYDPGTDLHSRERLRLAEELPAALEGDQLLLHYQPQCDVATGAVVGVEALVRWEHPRRGLLYPDVFLPLVEQSGLMGPLTLMVLRKALHQCRQWQLDGLDLGMSVNLSASNLLDQELPEQVAWLVASSDVPAGALTLELTESTLMADPEQCRSTLGRLAELGVGLSIDDYGTGYCSLAYLRDLPVDELKLDRTFLLDLHDPRSVAIVRSTIDLAHALDLRLVAEGVEDELALVALRGYGCDSAQGYHLSRPQPAAALEGWLRAQPARVPL